MARALCISAVEETLPSEMAKLSGSEPIRSGPDAIALLREQIAALGQRPGAASRASYQFGIPEIDASFFEGALPCAAVHEFISDNEESAAATEGFLAAMTSDISRQRMIVWITQKKAPFAPGLLGFGLRPDDIVFIELPREKDALWATEEALRCQGIGAVIAELADPDLTATRRLQLAVESSGVTGFLVRTNLKRTGSSACVTRWRVRPQPSVLDDGMPGVGFPRWDVQLLKARNGRPGRWTVEYRGGGFRLVEPGASTESIPVVAPALLRAAT